MSIYLRKSASIQPRTSFVKFARSLRVQIPQVEAKLENTVRAAIPQMIAEMPLEEDCENENGEDKREEIELALRKQRILKKPDEFSEEKDLKTCTSTNSMSSTIAMSGPPEVTRAVLMTQGWVVSISKLGTARSRLYRSQILQVNIK